MDLQAFNGLAGVYCMRPVPVQKGRTVVLAEKTGSKCTALFFVLHNNRTLTIGGQGGFGLIAIISKHDFDFVIVLVRLGCALIPSVSLGILEAVKMLDQFNRPVRKFIKNEVGHGRLMLLGHFNYS